MRELITCVDRHGKTHEVDKKSLETRISASGILKEGDQYVMIKTEGSTLWEFPGGGLEKGETIEMALKREFVEETGLIVNMGKFISLREGFFFSDNSGQAYYTLRLFYEVLLQDKSQEIDPEMLINIESLTQETTNAVTYSLLEELAS
jgi:8-oxo-dGTP pyrophosphatase MutT (NUDIX family)